MIHATPWRTPCGGAAEGEGGPQRGRAGGKSIHADDCTILYYTYIRKHQQGCLEPLLIYIYLRSTRRRVFHTHSDCVISSQSLSTISIINVTFTFSTWLIDVS